MLELKAREAFVNQNLPTRLSGYQLRAEQRVCIALELCQRKSPRFVEAAESPIPRRVVDDTKNARKIYYQSVPVDKWN